MASKSILQKDLIQPEAVEGLIQRVVESLNTGSMVKVLEEGLAVKAEIYRNALAKRSIGSLDEEALAGLLQRMFSMRRNWKPILEETGTGPLKDAIRDLLHGRNIFDGWSDVEQRIELFIPKIRGTGGRPAVAMDLATELLHAYAPEKYVLWTRWVWDPEYLNGALACFMEFVTNDSKWEERGLGKTYREVEAVVRDVHGYLERANFVSGRPYDIDIFLAYLYADYFYKVFLATSKSLSGIFAKEGYDLVYKILGVKAARTEMLLTAMD